MMIIIYVRHIFIVQATDVYLANVTLCATTINNKNATRHNETASGVVMLGTFLLLGCVVMLNIVILSVGTPYALF